MLSGYRRSSPCLWIAAKRVFVYLLVVVSLNVSVIHGVELRRYEFTSDGWPYAYFGLGLPGPAGKVGGTFEVSLDFQQGVGSLLSLDARLYDVGANSGSPFPWDEDFFASRQGGSYYYDHYRPPLTGILESANFKPIYPGGIDAYSFIRAEQTNYAAALGRLATPEYSGPALGYLYELAPKGAFVLYHSQPHTEAPFIVYVEENEAFLSYVIPAIDDSNVINGARAIRIAIPEPSTLGVACSTAIICLITGRRVRVC